MTSRTDFNESWLSEMPMGVGKLGLNLFDTIKYNITDFSNYGGKVETIGNGYFKMSGTQVAYFWHIGQDEQIDIAMELTVKPQALIVNGVGKSSSSNIHASDLYHVILTNTGKSIRLFSDDVLSDQGFSLWKRLLNLGHTISVYDKETPSAGLQPITSQRELEKFYQKDNAEYRRYQYVLSESFEMLAESRSYFNTYRMRTLAGLL